jgi:hypothetical protein
MASAVVNAEQIRLAENSKEKEPWYFWGPYVADRAWGTVREDYSANGDAWNYLPQAALPGLCLLE